MKSPSAFLPPIVRSVSPLATEPSDSRALDTATLPWLIRKVPLTPPTVDLPGAVDIDDLVAQFEATPKSALAIAKGRKWVAKAFYDAPSSLAALRLKHGWSQAELARRVGTSQSYVGRLETGNVDPQLSTMRKIALALGVPVAAMVDALTVGTQA